MGFTQQFGKYTTLASEMAAEATTATLSSAVFTNFTDDYLVIDYDNATKREVIKCDVTGTVISSATRAQEGTSDVTHAAGAKVAYMHVPSHYAVLKDGTGIDDNAITQSDISDVSDASDNQFNNSVLHNPTAGTFKDVDSLSVTLTTTGGDVLVSFGCTYGLSATRNTSWRLNVDDTTYPVKLNKEGTTGTGTAIAFTWVIQGLSAESHTFKIQATNDSTNVTFNVYDRFMSAVELKK
jgi:hypothetical protein